MSGKAEANPLRISPPPFAPTDCFTIQTRASNTGIMKKEQPERLGLYP